MGKSGLRHIDLNLLVAFESLMTEQHVTRAAESLFVSQPAMSRSLARLRELFDDMLFLRTPEGMVPTPRALELWARLQPSLADLSGALADGVESSEPREFVIATNDAAAYLMLPSITRRLAEIGPRICLRVVVADGQNALDMLDTGEVELAFGVFPSLPRRLTGRDVQLFREVCIVDRDNPCAVAGKLDMQTFISLPHVAYGNNNSQMTLDHLLEAQGLRRRIAVRTPYFLSIPSLVAGSGYIGIIARELLELSPERDRLKVMQPPVDISVMGGVAWHARVENDPAHRRLRELVFNARSRSATAAVA